MYRARWGAESSHQLHVPGVARSSDIAGTPFRGSKTNADPFELLFNALYICVAVIVRRQSFNRKPESSAAVIQT
jgi:hypothetical protein